MTALILPDCTPDRLRRIAYFLEISFIQDDIGDAQDLDPKLRERFSHGVKEALKVAVLGFLRDDPEMGVELMKQWKKWGNAQKQTASEVVRAKDVDGYLELRYEDGAMNMMIPIIQFANNIKLSDELIATLDPATKLIATSAILTNDYLSWEKESMSYQGDKRSDSDVPLNTIAFYKHTHGMSTEEARQTVRAKSMQLELEYIQVRDDILAQQGGDLQSFEFDNAIAWFDQLEHLVSGLHAWSLYSLRYHKADVNPYKDLLQLKE